VNATSCVGTKEAGGKEKGGTYEIFSSSQELGLHFRLRSSSNLHTRLRRWWYWHSIKTRNPRVVAIEAVDAHTGRAARYSSLEALAVLLQTHTLSALAASFVCNIITLVTTFLEL
jgi:hypothetical protein